MNKLRTKPDCIKLINLDSLTAKKIFEDVKYTTGFEFFSLMVRPRIPVASGPVYVVNNYNNQLMKTYMENSLWKQDPILQYRYSLYGEAIIWSDQFFWSAMNLWKVLQESGLHSGVSLLLSTSGSSMLTVFSLSSTDIIPINYSELDILRNKITPIYKAIMAQIRNEVEENIKQSIALTSREIDILRLSADGMTSAETAEKLFLTQSTVNFHLRNAMEKLKCKNKTQAVAKSILLGYI